MKPTEEQLVALSKSLHLMMIRRNKGGVIHFPKYRMSHNILSNIGVNNIIVENSNYLVVLEFDIKDPTEYVEWNGTSDMFHDLWQEIANFDEYLFGIGPDKLWEMVAV